MGFLDFNWLIHNTMPSSTMEKKSSYNVFSGKDKGEHFLFDATESAVNKLQNLFVHPSQSRKNL